MADSNYWSRYTNHRLGRRVFVGRGAAVGLGVAGLAVVGCSTSNNNNNNKATTAPSAAPTVASAAAGVTTPRPGTPATGAVTSTATRTATATSAAVTAGRSPTPSAASGAVVNGSYGKADGKLQTRDVPKTRGGTWRQFSYDALPPDNLDPHQSGFGPMWGIWSMLFSKLVSYEDPANEALTPDLATAMPEQADKLSYVFKLNTNAKWQNKVPLNSSNPIAGQTVTSADVKYSLERQMNLKSPRAGNYPALLSFLTIDKVETPDAQTVRITTKQPTAPLLAFLAGATGSIISQKLVDQTADEMNSPDKLIGSGPFILQDFTALKGVKYVKNPDWHLKDAGFAPGRPFLDAIESSWIPQDDNSIEGAFKAKQVDYTQFVVDQTNGPRIQKATPGTQSIPIPVTGPVGGLLPTDRPPWNDLKVRQAISMAVDRNAMGQFFYQGSFRINSPVSWADTHWALPQADLLKRPGYRYTTPADRDADIKAAKQMLDAAGGPSIIPSSAEIIYSTTPVYIPTYFPQFQKNLKDVLGVNFNGHLDTTGYTEIIAALLQKKFDFYWSYGNGFADLDDWVYGGHSGNPYNFAGINDPAYDALLDKQRAEFDFETRQKAGFDIQNMQLDKIYGIPMVALVNQTIGWNYMHNIPLSPWFNYNNLWANVWIDTSDPSYQGRPA